MLYIGFIGKEGWMDSTHGEITWRGGLSIGAPVRIAQNESLRVNRIYCGIGWENDIYIGYNQLLERKYFLPVKHLTLQ